MTPPTVMTVMTVMIITAVIIILVVLTALIIPATRNIRESIADPTPGLESSVETPIICKRTFTFQRDDDNVHDWQMTATDVCRSGSLIN